MKIKPFQPSDEAYAAITAISQAIWPDDVYSVELFKHWDRTRDPKYWFQRYVLEAAGQVVAYGAVSEPSWSYRPGKYAIGIFVHPEHQGRGYGAALYDHFMTAIGLREIPADTIIANTREDQPRGLRFLADRGFEQVMRFARSGLDVTQFEPQRFAAKVERVRTAGIVFKTIAELREEDPNWLHRLYELDWELAQDEPKYEEFTKPDFDVYAKSVTEDPNFFPEAWFIALDGDEWVGMSALWYSGRDDKLNTGFTAVARTHRRIGLATALKTAAISYAKSLGYKEIETDNEENNPMYQLNLQLGFRPLPAIVDFAKKIEQPEAIPAGVAHVGVAF